MPLLHVTEGIERALEGYAARIPDTSKDRGMIAQVWESRQCQHRLLWRATRSVDAQASDTTLSDPDQSAGAASATAPVTGELAHNFHELVRGSHVVFPPKPAPRAPSAELVARRERLRAAVEEAEYNRMVSTLPQVQEARARQDDDEMASVGSQLSIGTNLVVTMVSMYVFGYFVTGLASPDMSLLWRHMAGVVCCVGMMMVETWLFLIRGTRADHTKEHAE